MREARSSQLPAEKASQAVAAFFLTSAFGPGQAGRYASLENLQF
jgi:hypothetical protein